MTLFRNSNADPIDSSCPLRFPFRTTQGLNLCLDVKHLNRESMEIRCRPARIRSPRVAGALLTSGSGVRRIQSNGISLLRLAVQRYPWA